MLHIYHEYHPIIMESVKGSSIKPSYLASLISLESRPAGNPHSRRFERSVYRRLLSLKYSDRSFGSIKRSQVANMSDADLLAMSHSYGLTQILGYHCLYLGCTLDELKGKNHLKWAVKWMEINYGDLARDEDWDGCFRFHNTGSASGSPSRRDYVDRGLARMKYYRKWMDTRGSMIYLIF